MKNFLSTRSNHRYKIKKKILDEFSLEEIIPSSKDLRNPSSIIDLSKVRFIHPWGSVGFAMILSSFSNVANQPKIVLPKRKVCAYMQRMRYDKIFEKLNFDVSDNLIQSLEKFRESFKEYDSVGDFLELYHIENRLNFEHRFKNKILKTLNNAGLDNGKSWFIYGLILELIDNSFIHNLGNWPLNNIFGAFICIQNFSKLKSLKISIGDVGQGIRSSFKNTKYRDIMKDDKTAIKRVFRGGYTSRPQERGGIGLQYILNSILKDFKGILDIRSGICHIKRGLTEGKTLHNNKYLIGTLVQLTIKNVGE